MSGNDGGMASTTAISSRNGLFDVVVSVVDTEDHLLVSILLARPRPLLLCLVYGIKAEALHDDHEVNVRRIHGENSDGMIMVNGWKNSEKGTNQEQRQSSSHA